MKNRLWIITFLIFLVVPVGAGSVYRAAHPDEDRLQIEEQENRRMAEIEWDRLIDSCQSIDNWYNDRAPLRGPLMRLYRSANDSAELFFDENVAVPLDRMINGSRTEPKPDDPAVAGQTPDFDWAAVFNGDDPEIPIDDPIDDPAEEPGPEPEPSGEESLEEPVTDPAVSDPETSLENETEPGSSSSEPDAETGTEQTTPAPATTKADKTTAAPETTKAKETTKAVVTNEPVPTQPARSDPKKEHNLVKIQTVEPDYEHWGYTDYRCTDCGKGFRLDVKYKLVDSSQLSPRTIGQNVIVGRRDWLFLNANRSVEYYKGQCLPTSQELTNYASILTQIKTRCDKLGIKLIVLIAPNKEQVYSEYLPSYSVVNSDKREPRIVRHLQSKGITVLYPISELKAGDLYHETYHRTDTHWTPYGAYIANTLIEKKLGMSPADPYSIDLPGITRTIRKGDLVQLAGLSGKSIPYFVPQPNKTVSLTSDKSSSNGNVRRTVSSNPNNKSLVLIGDSFRINMSDTLAKDFQKTLILHRDYLSTSMKNEILRANVLVLETVERYDVQFFSFLSKVLEIVKMNPDPVTETPPETTQAPTTTAAPETTPAPTTEAPTTEAPTTAHSHSWGTGSITKDPTCTNTGTRTYTCSCGETRTEEIAALGHSWNSGVVTTEASCTKDGVRTFTCSRCSIERTEKIAASGHSWNSGVVTTEASCTKDGVKTFTCSKCNAERTEAITALGHSWDDGVITIEATCTKDGVKTFTCLRCHETRTETISAHGHHFVDGSCTNCGDPDPNYQPPETTTAEVPTEAASSENGSPEP